MVASEYGFRNLVAYFAELSELVPITAADILIPTDEPVFPEEVEQPAPEQEIPEEETSVDLLGAEEGDEAPATINEQFGSTSDHTVAESLQRKPVASIMDSISLNQRYMFAQELFSGDANVFQKAIGEIEQERSFDDAVEHLVSSYARKNEWDMNSDAVKELLKAVFRKFR